MAKDNLSKIAVLAVYAVAMALFEAVVVMYLRELYYPSGFFIQSAQDLAVIPARILRVELWREAATVVMLAAVGFLAFSRVREKFWGFIFSFSIWDIFYYFFLFVFLKWPPTLGTTDVYFLIPAPWIGPVWVPLAIFSVLAIISFRIIKNNNVL